MLIYAEPKIRECLYFSRNMLLHFRRNVSKIPRAEIRNIIFSMPNRCRAWGVEGVQWLSGRVLDSRPRSLGLEPHCVVVLEQDTFILA